MKLKNLSIITIILFILSIFVFLNENKRGTDLLTGSDFVKGLDINTIRKISLSFGNDKKITLTRDSNKFLLENHKSYPASTEKVNELIYKIASIQVKEKTTSGATDEDLKTYELSNDKRKCLIELFDNNGNRTVAFSVGKSHKNKGNYLLKEGKNDIYLSQESVWLNSSYIDFVNTVILEVQKNDIEKVSLKSDETLEIYKKDNEFIIENKSNKQYNKEKIEEYTRNFSSIKFDDFFNLTEPSVQALNFDKDVEIQLQNKLIYKVSLAKDKNDHYLKLIALLDETPKQFVVKQDDSKDELQMIENAIKAQADAQKINLEKGSWVYKVNKSVYEKLAKDSKFFL